ncbi:MAG TPA: transglutaminase domain-containing protein [Vicinamibacterales bacterium]
MPAKEPFSPDKARRPLRPHLPKPRRSGDVARGGLTSELKALYASVMGEHAFVEQRDGRLMPVETALFAALRSTPRYASLVANFSVMPAMQVSRGALPAPTPEDLAETPETRRSPELVKLATSLGNSPLALYNYVHTQIQNELYYGSKKGAAATLAEGWGNDFDQASLLVALLRAAGVPARYEYGVVTLSTEQALALSGASDVSNAYGMLSKVSPVALTVSLDGATLQMERAWVRAYVPYGEYRGTGPGGSKLWVRLDPGMKRVKHGAAVDLRGLVTFDPDAYLSTMSADSPVDAFEAQLLAVAKSRNLCNTLDEAISKADVVQDSFRLLPAEHAARVLESLLVFARAACAFPS